MDADVIVRDVTGKPMMFEVVLSTLHGTAQRGIEARERLLATRAHRAVRMDGYAYPMEFADAELQRRGFSRSGKWRRISGQYHAEVSGVKVK